MAATLVLLMHTQRSGLLGAPLFIPSTGSEATKEKIMKLVKTSSREEEEEEQGSVSDCRFFTSPVLPPRMIVCVCMHARVCSGDCLATCRSVWKTQTEPSDPASPPQCDQRSNTHSAKVNTTNIYECMKNCVYLCELHYAASP